MFRVIQYFAKSLKIIRNGTIRKYWYAFLFVYYLATVAVSLAVCEMFTFKEWRDLEHLDTGCSRSLKMAQFDRPDDFLLVGHCNYSSVLYHSEFIWR